MVFDKKKISFLRSKAVIQIYLVLIYIIISAFAISPVSAQETGCCSDDGDGNYCVPTTNDNCSGQWNSASCEQTSFCTLGCCLNGDDGTCNDNVPRVNCEIEENSTFQNVNSCESINSCQYGCCQIGNQYLFVSESECRHIIDTNYPSSDFSEMWDSSINLEYACISQSISDELGCCVDYGTNSLIPSCNYQTQGSCSTFGEELTDSGSGFFLEDYCSNLDCPCTSHASKGCFGPQNEDVYWYDSCGNPEELVEECQYFPIDGSGTFCDENSGDAFCKSMDCETTVNVPNNPQDSEMGKFRSVGESWCSYDGPSGGFYDRPGSRHYRHICINGEELVEECRDYREEICIFSELESTPEISVAQCRPLKTFAKIDLEEDKVVQPGESRFNDNERPLVSVTTVDKGSKFWKSGGNQCEKGNAECTVVYVRQFWWSDYVCEVGCECEEEDYIAASNDYCRIWGDCGADINILSKETTDGLEVDWSGDAPGPRPDEVPDDYLKSLNIYGVFGSLPEMGSYLSGGDIGDGYGNEALFAIQMVSNAVILYTSLTVGLIAGGAISSASWVAGTFAVYGTQIGIILGGAAGGGFFAGVTAFFQAIWAFLGWIGLIIIVLVIIFGDYISKLLSTILGFDTMEKEVEVTCKPWVAPSGGDDCEKCDNDKRYNSNFYENPVMCEEYRCRSLGTACELVNVGTTQQACMAKDPNDVTAPKIKPWNSLIESQRNSDGQNYQVDVYAGGNGFSITPEVDPLGLMTIGIKTDELARCRWDTSSAVTTFNEMDEDFNEGNEFVEMHNLTWGFAGGEDVKVYVRCIDFYENGKDAAPYVIDFRTKSLPDFKSPWILDYSLPDGIVNEVSNGNAKGVIGSGINATPLILYLDEPVEVCRWSEKNVPFIQMDENNIFYCGCYDPPANSACLGSGNPVNGTELCDYFDSNGALLHNQFKCVGELNNITLGETNEYFISCVDVKKDYGGGCNVINPSKRFELESSVGLSITNVEPVNGTYYDPNFVLHLTTSGGAEHGNAVCDFNEGYGNVEFFDTGNTNHFQSQIKTAGTYGYEFTCEDIVGNTAKAYSSIIVDVDEIDPVIRNIYAQGGQLVILTDENSVCEYSTTDDDFNLGNGIEMAGNMVKSHSLTMNEDVYYVQCYDVYGNEGNIVTIYNTL